MENKRIKYILGCFAMLVSFSGVAQETWTFEAKAIRSITQGVRITDKPAIIDTVVPIPNINYPLLSRSMRTEISIEQIEASKIRIVETLEKLYPGYIRAGIDNYKGPLGEFYYNSERNRRMNYGVHLKHNSFFGDIKDYAPASFDNTTGHVFGEFFTTRHKFDADLDYLNHGYHFYGIRDTADVIGKDSLRNRVQGIQGSFRFSNFTTKDSLKLLYTVRTSYGFFHEFDPENLDMAGRNSNFVIGADFAYKQKKTIYSGEFDIRYNNYKFAYLNNAVPLDLTHNDNNTIIHIKPVVTSYGDKWKIIYGVDLNFDIDNQPVFKVIPVLEAKYSLFNNMFIPYAGIDGGLQQNTFRTLNRQNEFISSEIDLLNTKVFNVYAGVKGTLSKKLSFNLNFHSTTSSDMALFVNDTIWSDLYRFDVVYDKVNALGVTGSISYQAGEKLKVDAIVSYNKFATEKELHAWNLAPLDIKLRGSYNLYDKIYIKSDLTFLSGRKSPGGLFSTEDNPEKFELGFVADANLHLEYRLNTRFSAFLQFNNLAAQKYFRWNQYQVQGFQVLGGVTFGF